jgi:hypothetical protein
MTKSSFWWLAEYSYSSVVSQTAAGRVVELNINHDMVCACSRSSDVSWLLSQTSNHQPAIRRAVELNINHDIVCACSTDVSSSSSFLGQSNYNSNHLEPGMKQPPAFFMNALKVIKLRIPIY